MQYSYFQKNYACGKLISVWVPVLLDTGMGRYSYSQPSSSSVRLCSGDEPDVSSTTRDYGIPNLCYCGLRTMMKTMDNTDAYPGRMFFGCKDYKVNVMVVCCFVWCLNVRMSLSSIIVFL